MRGIAVAVVVGLTALGCTPDWAKQNDSPVLLLIGAINGGNTLLSDVSEGGLTITDFVDVALAVRAKNPLGPQAAIIPMHVILTQYSVRFFRTDGHSVEGVDVPYHFTGAMGGEVDVQASGTSSFAIPLVRASAKQEPPLRNFRAIFPTTNTNPVTGRPVIQMIAEITIYGHTVAEEPVSTTGRVTVEFSDLP